MGWSDRTKFLCCSGRDSLCHHVHYRCLHGHYTDIYRQKIEKWQETNADTIFLFQKSRCTHFSHFPCSKKYPLRQLSHLSPTLLFWQVTHTALSSVGPSVAHCSIWEAEIFTGVKPCSKHSYSECSKRFGFLKDCLHCNGQVGSLLYFPLPSDAPLWTDRCRCFLCRTHDRDGTSRLPLLSLQTRAYTFHSADPENIRESFNFLHP